MSRAVQFFFTQGHWYTAELDLGDMGRLVSAQEIEQVMRAADPAKLGVALQTLRFRKLTTGRGRWQIQGQWNKPSESVTLPAEVLRIQELTPEQVRACG